MQTFRHIFLKIFLLVTIFFCPQIIVSNPQDTAIVMDMDDVMSIRQKPSVFDFIGLSRIVLQHPWVLSALLKMGDLQEEGNQLGKTLNGSGNLVHAMLEKLKERGYGDFSQYEQEILDRATKPKPIPKMINAIRELKKNGYTVIGATNHDWLQEQAYRKGMRSHGVDPNELFDAVVVTRVVHLPTKDNNKNFFKPLANENLYAAKNVDAYKPNRPYYEVVKDVVKKVSRKKGNKDIDTIIFTDDKEENIKGAEKARLRGIHFKLSGESARKTPPADLQKTIASWKDQLRTYGVEIS